MEKSSTYINEQRREYALYVLQTRALPLISDGLKSSGRRALWTARTKTQWKTATLAGAMMPLHPHGDSSGSINTLAAPYGNNIPLLHGDGAFGTLLEPCAYGASRYTSVKLSDFTKDVVFADLEIVPMVENYDSTLLEPKHFLPLIPITLLNSSEGIAVGFASNILPRKLKDIIELQIDHLQGKKISKIPTPYFAPLDNKSHDQEKTDNDGIAYFFKGTFERLDKDSIQITKLPYGLSHNKFVDNLDNLIDKDVVSDYTDNSKNTINVTVKLKRGILSTLDDDDIYNQFKLITRHVENLNVIDFDGDKVWNPTPIELISAFTDWRLTWYKTRYDRLDRLLLEEVQKYQDILLAIKRNIGSTAKSTKSRAELKEFLQEIGIKNLDYIADLPVYRFTAEEREKIEKKMEEALEKLKEYKELLSNEGKRRKVFISELNEVLEKYA